MQRLTHKRENGIKNGYWSPNKKEELVQRLAEYENLEKTPKELMDCIVSLGKLIINDGWILVEDTEHTPENEGYVLVSFSNSAIIDIARYEEDEEGGAYYPGENEETYSEYGIFVNAWMPLPKPYRPDPCHGCFGAANNDCQICAKGGKV